MESVIKCFDLSLIHIQMCIRDSVRGGANWEDVYALIETTFREVNVELWRLDKG